MDVSMAILNWNETGYPLSFVCNVDRRGYHPEIHITAAIEEVVNKICTCKVQ